ncbi:MAG: hypothetical protein QOI00_2359 [Chloroflexota bacterium]|jgi:outer membrane murein-binding lipoprotein Lpp|nr:hypothetical protein [Chloroflexota bacterium]MEA2607602.1 hypothetical protein [Chloroflexota bacterium]
MLTDEGRSPARILEEWRAAERELADCSEASPDYDELAARVHTLASQYHEATRSETSAAADHDARRGPATSLS